MTDLLQVIIAFTLIIVIHELGHFLAARWAGIRVLAFAVGFGRAVCSFRKGLGFRWGSSEPEYLALLAARAEQSAGRGVPPRQAGGVVGGIYPTEYRLNWLPLGGYVKMLGQDDADPAARSDEADSYQRCRPWKRMIVISAGVIANIVSAAALYILVFHLGLPTEAPMVGQVVPGSPAATAVADNAETLGVSQPGLQTGDTIVSIDDDNVAAFKDITLASAMSARGTALRVAVRRPGVADLLRFRITPVEDPGTRMLQMGFGPALSGVLEGARASAAERAARSAELARLGFPGLEPGMRLTGIDGVVQSPEGLDPRAIDAAARASGGAPITLRWALGDRAASTTIRPAAEWQTALFSARSDAGETTRFALAHLAGLAPVLSVRAVEPGSGGDRAGLKAGDIFARLGNLEWPSAAEGVAEIQRVGTGSIDIEVLRPAAGPSGSPALVSLPGVAVRRGAIGFLRGDSAESAAILARWPALSYLGPPDTFNPEASGAAQVAPPPPDPPSGTALRLPAGARVLALAGVPVASMRDIRAALQQTAASSPPGALAVTLDVEFPFASGLVQQRVEWRLSEAERDAVTRLGWVSTLPTAYFQFEEVVLKGQSTADSLGLGLRETHKVMLSTYLTFARLAQGTVKVEHLKGPVGIATVGTHLADRGFVWLLFFMAIVSVNLAVINFLPLPIVDGGHFLFLLYEQITGKPVSVLVQNIATIAGLIMIGTVFVITTFNDLSALASSFWG